MNDISLDVYCDSINSDSYYIEDFRNWVKEGIHGKDLLPRSRWDEIWDDFAGTFDDEVEEENVTEFEVDVNLEKSLKVRKINGKWKCSDGSVYMGYLKPKDIVAWLRRDYGQAWLIESVNKSLKEISINFPGSKTFDYYEGFEADVDYWYGRYCEDVDAGVNDPDVGIVEYIAGKIEQEHPTENPMQFDSLMKWVRETLPKVDKNWYSNMWGPVKEKVEQPFVFIKIFDPYEDGEAESVVRSYGGQIDYDAWTISKENIQDIKDELYDWENRIAFYSSYNDGTFGRKLKEAKQRIK